MTNPLQTIPNLPPAISLAGPEQLWINQAGVDRRTTLEDIGEFFTLGEFLPITGGTMTGALYVEANMSLGDGHSFNWGSSGRYDVVDNGTLYYFAANGTYCYMDTVSNFYASGSLYSATNLYVAGSTVIGWGGTVPGPIAVEISAAAGESKSILFETNRLARWNFYTDASPEPGSNVGSNLNIAAYDDSGNYLGVVLGFQRATGYATFGNGMTVNGNVIVAGANTIYPGTGGINWPSNTFIDYANATQRSWGGTSGLLMSLNESGNLTCTGNISSYGSFAQYGAQANGANYLVQGYYSNGVYYNTQQCGVNVAGTTVVFSYNNNTEASYVSATVSDRRLKSNIKAAGDALAVISGLPVYDLDFKPRGAPGEGFAEAETEHWPFSLIADEVAETLPHAAIRAVEKDDDHWVGLHPQHLVATLWRAVQQLTEQNETLLARVQALEARA